MLNIEKQLPKIVIKQTRKNKRRQHGNQHNGAVCRFDGAFRAVAHAVHAAFAVECPKWAVVNGFDGFHGARFNAQAAVVAGRRSIVGFGEEKADYKVVAQRNRRNEYILNNFANRPEIGSSGQYFLGKAIHLFAVSLVQKFHCSVVQPRVHRNPVRGQINRKHRADGIAFQLQD